MKYVRNRQTDGYEELLIVSKDRKYENLNRVNKISKAHI